MQNVLIAFQELEPLRDVVQHLANVFDETSHDESIPDQYVLRSEDDYMFLTQYFDIKENWEQWFREEDYDLVMSLESFVELRFQDINMAKKALKYLAALFPDMVIVLDDFYLKGTEFLSRLNKEPEWDWRDYEWNPWLNYNWGSDL